MHVFEEIDSYIHKIFITATAAELKVWQKGCVSSRFDMRLWLCRLQNLKSLDELEVGRGA